MSSVQKPSRTSQALLLGASLLSGAGAIFFGFFYFTLYWPYRSLFNEERRYFDKQNLVVYHQQSGLLLVPTMAFLLIAIAFVGMWRVRSGRVTRIVAGP